MPPAYIAPVPPGPAGVYSAGLKLTGREIAGKFFVARSWNRRGGGDRTIRVTNYDDTGAASAAGISRRNISTTTTTTAGISCSIDTSSTITA